jgi:hypothetical protein
MLSGVRTKASWRMDPPGISRVIVVILPGSFPGRPSHKPSAPEIVCAANTVAVDDTGANRDPDCLRGGQTASHEVASSGPQLAFVAAAQGRWFVRRPPGEGEVDGPADEQGQQGKATYDPIDSGTVASTVRRARRRAGIAQAGSHRLRHTAACEMVQAKVPLD